MEDFISVPDFNPHENGHSSVISPLSIWLDLNRGGEWI